jgi:hypothetical protein
MLDSGTLTMVVGIRVLHVGSSNVSADTTRLRPNSPWVRLNIISELELVHQVINIDLLSQSLLPAIYAAWHTAH